MSNSNRCMAVEFEGALATWDAKNPDDLGEPILAMVDRLKRHIADGGFIRVVDKKSFGSDFVANGTRSQDVADWCFRHLGFYPVISPIPTTYVEMMPVPFWSSRVIQTEFNTGRRIDRKDEELPETR